MRQHLPRAVSLGLALGLALTACASGARAPRGPALPGHWVLFRHVPESAGFVPPGFSAGDAAYLADRFSEGNRHPGTDNILRLPGQELISAGVRAGDLLVATEASARTIVVRCASSCTARYIAAGPAITHAEGHIAFTSAGR